MGMKHLGHASKLREDERFCTCCKKPLSGKVRWLELDQRTWKYHDRGDVPTDQSQGWFVFGLTCATNELKK
jgi:hypothetical protein